MFRSSTQPLCMYCGKKIAKWTDSTTWISNKVYRSLADVQRDNNQKVVHVRYDTVMDGTTRWDKLRALGAQVGERVVTDYSTWDGESYIDEFFCNGTCTRKYAYTMATHYQRRNPAA
jgi:hypothetical protein